MYTNLSFPRQWSQHSEHAATSLIFSTAPRESRTRRQTGTIQPQDRCRIQFVKRENGIPIMGRGLLLWLLGIPLPIILLVWLLGGLHG
jgi:hypothetical protein